MEHIDSYRHDRQPATSLPTDGIRVLLVEADPDTSELALDVLADSEDGFTVVRAADGAEAWRRLGDDIDCLVSGYDLPDTNGAKLLESVHERYPSLPLLLFADADSEGMPPTGIPAGVSDYLQTSPGGNQCTALAARIRELVGNQRHRTALDLATDRTELDILRESIDHVHIPVLLTDPSQEDNPMVYVNRAFEEVTGYSRSDVLGRNCRILQGPETEAANVTRLREAIASEEPATVELRNYRKDGTMFWNRVRLHPIYDGDGELLRWFGSQADITEQKEAQRQLELENERLDEFSRVVAHDLRNPLQVAEGRLELVRDNCEHDQLSVVAEALDRCHTLVDDILAQARAGVRVETTRDVELAAVLENCWETVETGEARLTVETDLTLHADRSRLQQLLENFVRNAVQHCGDDVCITVGDLAAPSGFYIADDGPGIPAEKREQVFDSGYSTAADGTGLGLAINRTIAAAHDWEISAVDSDAGGTRFEIRGVITPEDG